TLQQQLQSLSRMQVPDGTLPPSATGLLREFYVGLTRLMGIDFLANSDRVTSDTARGAGVHAYSDRPRLILTSRRSNAAQTSSANIQLAIDLLRDTLRVVVPPGQNVLALQSFNLARGLLETSLESALVDQFAASDGGSGINASAATVLAAAVAQGIPFAVIS